MRESRRRLVARRRGQGRSVRPKKLGGERQPTRITVTLGRSLYERVSVEAEKRERTRAFIVRRCVLRCVDKLD